MRRFASLLLAASTVAGCVPVIVPQQPLAAGPVASCGAGQTSAPEFNLIRSRVNFSTTGALPPSYMLLSTERPTPEERIEIARWSQIRDTCFRQNLAAMSTPVPGIPQPLQQQMIEIFRQAGESQHALIMALARGDMSYGQFVQESTRVAVRMTAAMQPFAREANGLEQIAAYLPHDAVQINADENAAATSVAFNGVLEVFAEALVVAADAGAFDGHGGHGGSHARGHFHIRRHR